MRRVSWPGARLAPAAVCAVLCLAAASCSSGGGAASPPAHASHSSGQPASGPAAVAAVTSTWETFFNGAVPIPRRLTLLQDGQQFAAFVNSQAKTPLGSLVFAATATVSSVKLQPPGQASVTYTILLSGRPLEKNVQGTAVYIGGSWKVAVTTFCGLLHLAYGKSHLIPATCGG